MTLETAESRSLAVEVSTGPESLSMVADRRSEACARFSSLAVVPARSDTAFAKPATSSFDLNLAKYRIHSKISDRHSIRTYIVCKGV